MQKYSTIIIGAGPAGLAGARILARHGKSVLVLERKKQVGAKVCGGGITWSGLIRRVPEKIIERSFYEQYISSNWQHIKISSTTPIISTVSREKLGRWMHEQAVSAGAVVRTGCNVCAITDRFVTIKNNEGANESFAYQYLVGADGSNSLVRKHLGLNVNNYGVGIHYHVPGSFNRMHWQLDSGLFGNGYAWIFPFKEYASVGVYGHKRELSPRQMLANLHIWAEKKSINLKGLKARSALINFDYQGWKFGRIYLVGDAAGLASGLTGEGINPAIVSGEAAARAIINPQHSAAELARLISKQEKHQRILRISGKNTIAGKIIIELLVLGLRAGFIPIRAIEMAD